MQAHLTKSNHTRERTKSSWLVFAPSSIPQQRQAYSTTNPYRPSSSSQSLYIPNTETPHLEATKSSFFKAILHAWQLLIYDRLEPGSLEEDAAARGISEVYRESPIITLNETQVRTLDAMAEAAGIPRRRGQSKIPIPKKYADSSWRFDSPEWIRAATAHHERVNRDAELYKKGYRKRP